MAVSVASMGIIRRYILLKDHHRGVLSPLVWNLAMNDLLTQFKKGPVRALGYADDVIFLTKGIDPSTMTDLMQSAINKALSWAQANGVTFGAKKTQAVIFHTRRAKNKPKFPKLKMGEEALKYTNSMKYLGMTFQHNLTWNKHIEE